MNDDQPHEPDFLDILDAWDEPLELDDDEEPFVPMYRKPWFRYVAIGVAVFFAVFFVYTGIMSLFFS